MGGPSKTVSPFSSTMIGSQLYDRHENARSKFKEEAVVVSSYIKQLHPHRKHGHLQLNYSNTIQRLNHTIPSSSQLGTVNQFQSTSSSNTSSHPHISEETTYKLKAHMEEMSRVTSKEALLNEKKRLFNGSKKPIVHDIITGRAPMPEKEYLFAHNQSHSQILAMTGGLKMSDPHKVPEVRRASRKWLGDDQGWTSQKPF